MYFNESLAAYKVALGMDHSLTIDALKDFSKWLIRAGKREVITTDLSYTIGYMQTFINEFSKPIVPKLLDLRHP